MPALSHLDERAAALREARGAELTTQVLPVEFTAATRRIGELMTQVQPHIVLSLGLADGRRELTPERVAINLADARMPDNSGAQPIDEPLAHNGPAAYFSTLPIKAMTAALRHAQIPAAVSQTAGTYVCNAVFYTALHSAATMDTPPAMSGFLHVPSESTLPQPTISRGVEIALRTALAHLSSGAADLRAAEGSDQ